MIKWGPYHGRAIRLTLKEIGRADSESGVTIAVRPQADGTWMVVPVRADTGMPFGGGYVAFVDDRSEIQEAVYQQLRMLDKMGGSGGDLADASRHRSGPKFDKLRAWDKNMQNQDAFNEGTIMARNLSAQRVAKAWTKKAWTKKAKLRGRTKKDFQLRDWDVIREGTRVEILFSPGNTSTVQLIFDVKNARGVNYSLRVPIVVAYKWVTGITKPPSFDALEKMVFRSVVSTPTGKRVEPDGWANDGSPSWLLVMGLI